MMVHGLKNKMEEIKISTTYSWWIYTNTDLSYITRKLDIQ